MNLAATHQLAPSIKLRFHPVGLNASRLQGGAASIQHAFDHLASHGPFADTTPASTASHNTPADITQALAQGLRRRDHTSVYVRHPNPRLHDLLIEVTRHASSPIPYYQMWLTRTEDNRALYNSLAPTGLTPALGKLSLELHMPRVHDSITLPITALFTALRTHLDFTWHTSAASYLAATPHLRPHHVRQTINTLLGMHSDFRVELQLPAVHAKNATPTLSSLIVTNPARLLADDLIIQITPNNGARSFAVATAAHLTTQMRSAIIALAATPPTAATASSARTLFTDALAV